MFEGRDALAQEFCPFDFELGRPKKGRATTDAFAQGVAHGGMGVTQDEGGGIVDKVEAAVAIDIVDINTLAPVSINWKGIDKNASARIATGQNFLCAFEKALRICVLIAVVGNELVKRKNRHK